ncbi:hypothetical protein Nepgr_030147 [Nepenthes gracilis]|uniref:Uncharacterized protein n=1 Tax=Nepenthes gracilis TaxID=150966 RepID=A0AAD3Y5S7_NEPGR|nr:hypothetical protein Nepgr_030147 [Nepenthes gracilis]
MDRDRGNALGERGFEESGEHIIGWWRECSTGSERLRTHDQEFRIVGTGIPRGNENPKQPQLGNYSPPWVGNKPSTIARARQWNHGGYVPQEREMGVWSKVTD